MTIMEMKSTKSGFDLFNYYRKLHSTIVFGDDRLLLAKTNDAAKRTFNATLRHIKDMYGVTNQDIKLSMVYMYYHNPLGIPYAQYGSVKVLAQCIPYYLNWSSNQYIKPNVANILSSAPNKDAGLLEAYEILRRNELL